MGYTLTTAAKNAFMNSHQGATIYATLADESTKIIRDSSIKDGGLTIDRFCTNGDFPQLGCCGAAQLDLTLDNSTNTFNNVDFYGAMLTVTIIVSGSGASYSCPMGVFIVDTVEATRDTIHLSALDRMTLFDKEADLSTMTFPMTASALLTRVCSDCGVTLVSPGTLQNGSYSIPAAPEGSPITYRQLLIWLCEMFGRCGYMDWNGALRLGWYADSSADDDQVSRNVRFTSSVSESTIMPDGFVVFDAEGNAYTWTGYATSGRYFVVSGNALLQGTYQTVADNLSTGTTLPGFVAFDATTLSMPWLWPMDSVWVMSNTMHGGSYFSYGTWLTNTTFKLNGRQTLKCQAVDKSESDLSNANPLSPGQSAAISSKLSGYLPVDSNGDVVVPNGLTVGGALTANGLSLDFYLITGTLASSADWGTDIAYPSGLDINNCQIVSFEVYNAAQWKTGYGLTSAVDRRTFAALRPTGINAFNNDSGLYGADYRVLLRKL